LKLTKGITLEAGNSTLEIAYLLEGLPGGRHFHLGVEFNFAGLPGGTPDRYYVADDHRTLGPLDALLDLNPCPAIGLVDEWLGIELQLHSDAPTGFWCYPVRTVSQSEGGFELVHQSVVVEPHWDVVGDKEGRWSATMRLVTNPPHAERLLEPVRAAATL
jgi:alpha-amylase